MVIYYVVAFYIVMEAVATLHGVVVHLALYTLAACPALHLQRAGSHALPARGGAVSCEVQAGRVRRSASPRRAASVRLT